MPHLTAVCHDSWHSHRVCHRHWGHTAQTFQPWIYKYIEEKKYLRDNVTRKVWYFIIWGVAFGINYCSWRGFTFLRYSDKGLLTSRSLLLHARHFGLRHWACVKQYKWHHFQNSTASVTPTFWHAACQYLALPLHLWTSMYVRYWATPKTPYTEHSYKRCN